MAEDREKSADLRTLIAVLQLAEQKGTNVRFISSDTPDRTAPHVEEELYTLGTVECHSPEGETVSLEVMDGKDTLLVWIDSLDKGRRPPRPN